MKQMTTPALTKVRIKQGHVGTVLDLVFNIMNQSLELLLELAPNSRASQDSRKINRENALVMQ